jgi:RND family efflux transporter MFP subunit
VIATLVAGCRQEESAQAPAEVPRNVRVMTLAKTTVTQYLEIAGPIEPVRGTDVSAEEQGVVAKIPHDKGTEVRAGAVLIELDRRLLAADLEAARSDLKMQEYNYDKVKQLHEARKLSRIDLLTAAAQYEQALARRDIAERRYERAAIKAPFAGIVANRYVEPGQLVAPGMPVARVIDPFTLKLSGYVTEREVAAVNEGDVADIVLEGTDQIAAGSVAWVGFEADLASGKFPVEIEIPNGDLQFRSGAIGRARLRKEVLSEIVAIPRDAVIPTRTGPKVFVVEGERAVARRIELGPDQGLMVAVTKGLETGEFLVVRGQRELADGNLVKITERTTAPDGSLESDPEQVRSSGYNTRVERAQEAAR